jgi:hypothetical protein
VRNHFADPADMKVKPEHSKLAGYFNMDNGTGQNRGVYLQGNYEECRHYRGVRVSHSQSRAAVAAQAAAETDGTAADDDFAAMTHDA